MSKTSHDPLSPVEGEAVVEAEETAAERPAEVEAKARVG